MKRVRGSGKTRPGCVDKFVQELQCILHGRGSLYSRLPSPLRKSKFYKRFHRDRKRTTSGNWIAQAVPESSTFVVLGLLLAVRGHLRRFSLARGRQGSVGDGMKKQVAHGETI